MPRPLGFLAIYLLVLPLGWVIASGRLGLFVTPLVVLLVVPFLDLLLGRDRENPPAGLGPTAGRSEKPRGRAGRSWAHSLVLWFTVPAQLAILVGGLAVARQRALGGLELLDLVLSLGLLSGSLAINTAHELVHRPSRFERALGYLQLWTVAYMHWGIEHVHGHHRWVSTPRDPATSRRGETLYAFVPRALVGEVASAWRIEARRLAARGRPVFSTQNPLLWFFALEAALGVGLAVGLGPRVALVWLGQAVVAAALLQVINYVEHYGLVRRELRPGEYERVTPRHSWNASEWLTNRLLFNLQRHADHHAFAARPYHLLRHYEESPQLPTGYGGMLLLALVPPLFFHVMDPRLDALEAGPRPEAGGVAGTPTPAA